MLVAFFTQDIFIQYISKLKCAENSLYIFEPLCGGSIYYNGLIIKGCCSALLAVRFLCMFSVHFYVDFLL